MAAARRVGVGEFVDQNQLGRRLRIASRSISARVALVFDLLPRDHLEAVEQRLGLAPTMRLDDADEDIDPVAPLGLRGKQHLIGLADSRRGAEKNLQPPAALLLGRGEQRFW